MQSAPSFAPLLGFPSPLPTLSHSKQRRKAEAPVWDLAGWRGSHRASVSFHLSVLSLMEPSAQECPQIGMVTGVLRAAACKCHL